MYNYFYIVLPAVSGSDATVRKRRKIQQDLTAV